MNPTKRSILATLQPFCLRKGRKSHPCRKPWTTRGYCYATDGKIICRHPLKGRDTPALAGAFPPAAEAFRRWPAPLEGWIPVPAGGRGIELPRENRYELPGVLHVERGREIAAQYAAVLRAMGAEYVPLVLENRVIRFRKDGYEGIVAVSECR